jgi:tetratricopeptide (TPR) repeat protein
LRALFKRDSRPPAEEGTAKDPRRRVLNLIKEGAYEQAEAALDAAVGLTDAERKALLAQLRYHARQVNEARDLSLDALHSQPGLARAHHVLSLIHYDAGEIEEALSHAHYARMRTREDADIVAHLGLCLIAAKDYGEARTVLRHALLLEPDYVPALNNLGIAHHAMQEYGEALYYLQRALALKPDYAPAQENLRNLFGIDSFASHYDVESNSLRSELETGAASSGRMQADEQAIAELESAFDANPEDFETAVRLVELYLRTLRLDDARDVLQLALARHPESVPILNMAGRMTMMLGQYRKSRAHYERALALASQDIPALLGLGQALRLLDLHEEALVHFEQAAALQADAHTLTQLAFAQVNACRYEDCLATCDRVEALRPDYAPFLLPSRAVCYAYLGRFDEALCHVEQAERTERNNLSFAMFRGMIHLQHENYAEGWQYYRYRSFSETKHTRLLPYPRWQGEPLTGKTILVLAEQGLGDQVMFASCLPDLLALEPHQVVLEAHKRVAPTLARSFPTVRVYPSNQRDFSWLPRELTPDFYVPIADLARHFRPGKEHFPAHRGYLKADAGRVAHWRQRLDAVNALPKVGLSWRGGLQQTRRAVRSLTLDRLLPLLSDPRFQFVNLQYGPVQEELAGFCSTHGLSIIDWPEAIADLDEFAALISGLDLVITVCNTTVHYAGALNKPCWVMAPQVPEWRYGIAGETMRWYPSVRMFRQPAMNAWDAVLTDVRRALDRWPAAVCVQA